MEIQIDVYEYVKVVKNNSVIEIPEEHLFYQEHNHRTIVGIFPKRADWEGGDGKVWRLELVKITDNQILKTILDITFSSLSRQSSEFGIKGKTQEDYFKDDVLRYIISKEYGNGRVSPQTYNNKLNEFMSKLEKP